MLVRTGIIAPAAAATTQRLGMAIAICRGLARRVGRGLFGNPRTLRVSIAILFSSVYPPAIASDDSKVGAVNGTNATHGTNGTNGTNASKTPSADSSKSATLDYRSFRIVAERNIFNADRARRSSRGFSGGDRPRPKQVSTISFVGYLGSAQGDRAFFDGSSSSYRKALKLGELVDQFKMVALSPQGVGLESGDRKYTLKIGEQLRREENGPWEISGDRTIATSGGGDTASAGATGASEEAESISTGASGAGADDVLQRLLKKRQQEENK